MTSPQHAYKIRPRRDHRGVDLISDALPFGRLWYTKPDDANRIREVSQPVTWCCDPRLRCSGQRGRNARSCG
jgi:hypothetical protein